MPDLFEADYRYAIEKRAYGVLWAFDGPHYLPNARPFLDSFRGLHSELSMVKRVSLDIEPDILYSRYVGGNPRYLVELLNYSDLGVRTIELKIFLAKANNITESIKFSGREVLIYDFSIKGDRSWMYR